MRSAQTRGTRLAHRHASLGAWWRWVLGADGCLVQMGVWCGCVLGADADGCGRMQGTALGARAAWSLKPTWEMKFAQG
jgi:hypothetical protein